LKQSYKNVVLLLFLVGLVVLIYEALNRSSTGTEIALSDFYHQAIPAKDGANAADKRVKTVRIRGNEIEGEYTDGNKFRTRGSIRKYEKELIDAGVKVYHEPNDQNGFWLSLIGTWLPMVFLFVIFIFFMRQIQSGGGKAMSFGKSRHHVLNESNNKVTFKDIAGIEEAKEELQEIIQFLKDPKKFTRLGGRIPKGVLLMGPPGTGKTLLAKGVAGEAGVPFFSISGSDFVEMFVGVGASRVRDLFEQGKKNAPCIIFVDEIDAVGRHRGAGMGGGHDEREQTLNQLLVEMDGFESSEGVIIIAATNRADVLDPALLRPGRFDRRVYVPLPDITGREGILKVHTRRVPLSKDVDIRQVARNTPGFSGADLENLVNEAALLAARRDKDIVEMDDFENSRDKVIMGPERRSMVVTEELKRRTAYHEAGHALVSLRVPDSMPIHKVTIIPRGQALGVTMYSPSEERMYETKSEHVLAQIATAMGGRAADEVALGRKDTGAANDIEQATAYARKFVTEWGLSNLGPINLGNGDHPIFLGRDMQRQTTLSEYMQIRVDREIQRILMMQYELARTVITENREALDRIAQALVEFETLTMEETTSLADGGTVGEIREKRSVRREENRVAAEARPAARETKPEPKKTPPSIVPMKPGSEET
jgi:cell division protease FtsH